MDLFAKFFGGLFAEFFARFFVNKESTILREIGHALSHYGFFVIPHSIPVSNKTDWSIWQEIDPKRYVGVVWRCNTGTARYDKKRFVRFGIPGLPDFLGFMLQGPKMGILVALEVKSKSGVLSSDQRAYGELVARNGILYGVVRSYEECITLLKSFNLNKKA